MSSSFLKKSLELVDSQVKVIQHKKVHDSYSQLKFVNKKKKNKDLRGVGDVKNKNIQAVEKARSEHKQLHSKTRNRFKVRLLHKPVNDKIINKILEHIGAPGRDSKKKEDKEAKTAFTEEDFAKFEKEYFAD